MRADAATSAKPQPAWLRKLVWLLLVVIVPVLAAVVMIGIALQIVGVPVWQTTVQYLSGPRAEQSANAVGEQSQLAAERAKEQSLSDQNAKLSQQLNDLKHQNDKLQQQVQQLQALLTRQQDETAQAKREAAVLVGMDPHAAATVLAKLSVQHAAQVVAQMSTTDSGQILAEMDPGKAAKILGLAAQIAAANAAGNTDSTAAGNAGSAPADNAASGPVGNVTSTPGG
jgi:flagellar motility protein MotE (MotC chaperone)